MHPLLAPDTISSNKFESHNVMTSIHVLTDHHCSKNKNYSSREKSSSDWNERRIISREGAALPPSATHHACRQDACATPPRAQARAAAPRRAASRRAPAGRPLCHAPQHIPRAPPALHPPLLWCHQACHQFVHPSLPPSLSYITYFSPMSLRFSRFSRVFSLLPIPSNAHTPHLFCTTPTHPHSTGCAATGAARAGRSDPRRRLGRVCAAGALPRDARGDDVDRDRPRRGGARARRQRRGLQRQRHRRRRRRSSNGTRPAHPRRLCDPHHCDTRRDACTALKKGRPPSHPPSSTHPLLRPRITREREIWKTNRNRCRFGGRDLHGARGPLGPLLRDYWSHLVQGLGRVVSSRDEGSGKSWHMRCSRWAISLSTTAGAPVRRSWRHEQ